MKHFFHPAQLGNGGQVNPLINLWSSEEEEAKEKLKLLYDLTDIIYDKRLDVADDDLKIHLPDFLEVQNGKNAIVFAICRNGAARRVMIGLLPIKNSKKI